MDELFQTIESLNSNGISAVRINRGGTWNNRIQNDFILWDAAPDALTLANRSEIKVDDRPLIIAISRNELLGFYLLGTREDDGRIRLEPYLCPRLGRYLLSAPTPPQGPVNGYYLTSTELNSYLRNLRDALNLRAA